MSRGFGATDGIATTDRIATNLFASGVLRSYGGYFYLTGAGGGGNGRLFARDPAIGTEDLVYSEATGTLNFFRSWSAELGEWRITAPATGGWHSLLMTYDGGVPGNVPIFYLDKTAVAVTPVTQPTTGTLLDVSGSALHFGNRPTAWARCLNGRLEDWAIWNEILVQADADKLGNGLRAGSAHPDNLLEWLTLDDDPVMSRVLAQPSVTGTALLSGPGLHYEFGKANAEAWALRVGEASQQAINLAAATADSVGVRDVEAAGAAVIVAAGGHADNPGRGQPMTGHPLVEAASIWTTNEDTLTRAQQTGDELDALVADALGSTDATVIREAVRQLDAPAIVWTRMNMPAPAATRWYEQHRRALNQRALALFGPRDGQLIAPRLEHEPFAPAAGRSLFGR